MSIENIYLFLTSRAYRRHWRRNYAKNQIALRHELVDKAVCVEEVFFFSEDSWKKKSFISVDGLRIAEYLDNIADQNLLQTLRQRYYVLHRHHILVKKSV